MTSLPNLSQLLHQAQELHRGGSSRAAEDLLRQTLVSHPDSPEIQYCLGQLYLQADRGQEALILLRQATELSPGNPIYCAALADAYLQLGSLDAAAALYRRALEQDPTLVDALCGLGCALGETDELEEAESLLRMAVALDTENGRAAAGLGTILLRQERWEEAASAMQRAQRAGYVNASMLNDLGVALQHLGRFTEAAEAWRAALALDGGGTAAWMNLGNLLRDEGHVGGARECYAHVLRARPADALRIRMATLLPPVYASRDEMLAYREAYANQLDELLSEPLRPGGDPLADGGHNNFYLCYQGENDLVLQKKLAEAYRRVYAPRHREAPKRGPGGRIRIGFVSSFFRDHTIGELNRGIIANLSRSEFEVFVFSIGRHDDPVARFIQSHADHYQVLPKTLAAAEDQIAACGLDVLLYTDIGMEPFSYFLAFSRLAPVQCVTWGHPVTTGIDTIDYYLSSVWQEPEDGDRHYSEKLVRLSQVPAYYYPSPPPAPRSRAELGLPEAAHLYVCPQSLFKFHPDFDGVLCCILEIDPSGQILVPDGHFSQWTQQLRARFQRTMPLVAERIRFLPRLGYLNYLQLLQVCNVMLDPVHFGGGKTTLDALSLGLPVITMPGQFMRGRATYACYRQIGYEGCVARGAEEYVQLALKLAQYPGDRQAVTGQILGKREQLAERQDLIEQLSIFFQRVIDA